MKWFLSSVGYALWCALDHPEHWKGDEYTWKYKGRVAMWVSNGASFYDLYNNKGSIGWFERRIIWRKHVRMVRQKTVGEFTLALFD